jgi:arginase
MNYRFLVSPFNLDQPLPELELLASPDWEVSKPSLPQVDVQRRMSVVHRPIADFVARTIGRGDRPAVIAGDCCASIGMMAGLQRAGIRAALIWLDAHGDFNTWETTPSGFIGGMPLAMLVGRGEQTMIEAAGVSPVREKDVFLMDGRSLDPGEKEALNNSDVHHFVDGDSLLRHVSGVHFLYVHFDTDVVSPQDAPAMTYCAPGGPRARDMADLFRALAETGQVGAVSMCAWDTTLDRDGRSRDTCMKLLHTLME